MNAVYLFSSDIGMELGIRKCGVLVMKRGKAITTDGIELPGGQVIKDIEKNFYKYLGILEMDKLKYVEWQEQNHCNKYMGYCSFTIWSGYTEVDTG